MTPSPIAPHVLAAGLAARLLHDLAGPASGVLSGLELHADPDSPDLGESAIALALSSGQALLEHLEFYRNAYGGADVPLEGAALERLARARFAGARAKLVWTPGMALSPAAAQILLILAQIAADGCGAEGAVRVSAAAGGSRLTVDGDGPRARLGPEVLEGLAGRGPSAGARGRWAPGAYLHALAGAVGAELSAERRERGFTLTAALRG